MGELNDNKNNGVIITAMEKLRNPHLHYILCGVGEKQVKLQGQADKAGLHDNVHFLGYRNDVKELYEMSDCFVMPSFREGLSRSIMEAMASGLPCIVSDIRGNRDLIDDKKGGYLVVANDSTAFSEKINSIVSDISLKKEMRDYNIRKIEKFSTEKVKHGIIEIYRNK